MTILFLPILGCKSEEPNPELRDPIYKFLLEKQSQLKSALEGEIKKVEEAEIALEKTDPLTPERKAAIRDLQLAKKRRDRMVQEKLYLDIRAERRRVEGRRDYKIAFHADKPWPDPAEFEHFQTNMRLRTAPRQWDARVPKLQDRILKAWPPPSAVAKKEAAPEGGSSGH